MKILEINTKKKTARIELSLLELKMVTIWWGACDTRADELGMCPMNLLKFTHDEDNICKEIKKGIQKIFDKLAPHKSIREPQDMGHSYR